MLNDTHEELPEAVQNYLSRVESSLPDGLALRVGNFRKFLIERVGEGEYANKVRVKVDQITIDGDGGVRASKKEYEPTPEEAEAIRAGAPGLPKPVPANKAGVDGSLTTMLTQKRGQRPTLFVFFDVTGNNVLFVQERVYDAGGEKTDLPWTFWSDAKSRNMEPDGPLPLFGLEQLKLSFLGTSPK